MGDHTAFITGLDLATIRSGGVTIDSSSFAITIGQSLLTGGGNGGLTKIGSGTLLLNGTNTYTGTTLVSFGTLGGDGSFVGPMTVASGATLSPGNSIGRMTVSNVLTLSSNSTTVMEFDTTLGTNDNVVGLTSVNYGGTLSLVNLGVNLVAGNSLKLFDATSYTGSFASILPSTPSAGLAWNTSQLTVSGTLSVVAVTATQFNSVSLSGNTLNFSGSGGQAGGTYYVLASTNVELPTINWTRIATNNFDGSGNFNFNDTLNPAAARQFYLISTP
jgi:autotransporter-associated beta strand protein